ncbi:MAG: 4Fe-4S binding protein [Sulfolobaceae archaeon]
MSYKIILNYERCTHNFSAMSSCNLCIVNCPKNAIKSIERKIIVDESLCTQCGKCMEVCPTEAIIASKPYSSIVEEVKIVNNIAELTCGREINCIAHVNDSLIFGILAKGAEKIAINHCKRCPKGVNIDKEKERIKMSFNSEVIFNPKELEVGIKLLETRTEIELLREYYTTTEVIKREGVKLIRAIPEKRDLLVKSIKKLKDKDEDKIRKYIKNNFVMKKFDPVKCEYMGTCITLCPTGALRTDGKGRIYYRADACVKCRVCIDSCLLKGIENTEVEPEEVLEASYKLIAEYKLKRCVDCGTLFVARDKNDKYCRYCKNYDEELKRYFNS